MTIILSLGGTIALLHCQYRTDKWPPSNFLFDYVRFPKNDDITLMSTAKYIIWSNLSIFG